MESFWNRHWKQCVMTVALAAVVMLGSVAGAEGLKLPAIFADHGVLQRDADVPVWGWAEPGATVSVSMAGQSVEGTVGEDGAWRVDLAPMPAGGPYELVVTSGGDTITLADQLVGEVWLASGQSNMQWSITNTDGLDEEMARCENDNLRFAMVYREVSTEPLADLRKLEPWFTCTKDNLLNCYDGAGFSAVSYYFAKYVQAELGVPVGVINTSWGGTRIEPWTPPVGFEQVPALADIADLVEINTPSSAAYQQKLGDTIGTVEEWLPKAKEALEAGMFPPALPSIASASALNQNQSPTALYNAMVNPLVPYANQGFIWYQGESNRGEGMLYRDKMEALIRGWRAKWQKDDLASYFVQLAPFDYKNEPEALPEIWEAQVATLDLPGTGMAVINDIGNTADIHPRNKDDVGKRLALLALNKKYGIDVKCESPLFDHFAVEGNAMRVFFKHAESLQTRDGAAPTWFAIAGPDGVYRDATAVIDGATVVLTAEGVSEPVAVHFAWNHIAEPNLMNEAGLPASAFRAGEIPVDGALRTNVPEAADLKLVYAFDPTNPVMDGPRCVYTVDNSADFEGNTITRVAYFMQLVTPDGSTKWVYTEMDPFTQEVSHIGVPNPRKGAQYQQDVANLVVKSSERNVPSGAVAHGAIELWSCNYGPEGARGLEGASNERYDFDDTMNMGGNPGHGCLQIHDVGAKTTVLAFNNYKAGHSADVGIGNSPDGEPDWTFSKSAEGYEMGTFLVLVKTAD